MQWRLPEPVNRRDICSIFDQRLRGISIYVSISIEKCETHRHDCGLSSTGRFVHWRFSVFVCCADIRSTIHKPLPRCPSQTSQMPDQPNLNGFEISVPRCHQQSRPAIDAIPPFLVGMRFDEQLDGTCSGWRQSIRHRGARSPLRSQSDRCSLPLTVASILYYLPPPHWLPL